MAIVSGDLCLESENFHLLFPPSCATDVRISSSDGVLFHLSKQILEWGTGAFPPAHFTGGEAVKLTENATTLAILFQFLLQKKHPQLDKEPFGVVLSVAVAAEKRFVDTHPFEVLRYAATYGYSTTLDLVAPLFCRRSLTDLIDTLPSMGYLAAWIRYHQLSQSVFESVQTVLNCPTIPNALAITPKTRIGFDPFVYPRGAEAGVQFQVSGSWRTVCAGAGFALHQHLATLREIRDYKTLFVALGDLPSQAHPAPACAHQCEYSACLVWMADAITKGMKALVPFSTLAPGSDEP